MQVQSQLFLSQLTVITPQHTFFDPHLHLLLESSDMILPVLYWHFDQVISWETFLPVPDNNLISC